MKQFVQLAVEHLSTKLQNIEQKLTVTNSDTWLAQVSKLNTLRPRQDGRRFPDDTFERIFLKENVIILIKISLKFVPKGPINSILALVQIMAWRRSGDKPLSEPMMVRLPTHIGVTRPQWVLTGHIQDKLSVNYLSINKWQILIYTQRRPTSVPRI